MIDPSVFTSDRHMLALRKARKALDPIYIPNTFMGILERLGRKEISEREVVELLNYFANPFPQPYLRLSQYWSTVFSFNVKSFKVTRDGKQIDQSLRKRNRRLPTEAIQILVEEYSFMRQHSALLMRGKHSIRYLEKLVHGSINATNSLKDKKHDAFQKIRGPVWFVALLVASSAFLTNNPVSKAISVGGGVLIVYFDP